MDFVSWLEALPAATVGKLYGSQWACQAVLRSLPPLAKQYVARMLFVEAPIPSSKLARHSKMLQTEQDAHMACGSHKLGHAGIIQLWATSGAASKHLAALERLKRLQLLVSSPT